MASQMIDLGVLDIIASPKYRAGYSQRSIRGAKSTGLGEHPLICREHLNSRSLNLPRSVTIKDEQPTVGARMFPGSSGERPQLAGDCFGGFQRRTNLYEFLIASPIPDQEIDFQTLGGLHIAHFRSPPLELVQDSRLEGVTQVRAPAGIEGRNQSRVGRIDFSRVAVALAF